MFVVLRGNMTHWYVNKTMVVTESFALCFLFSWAPRTPALPNIWPILVQVCSRAHRQIPQATLPILQTSSPHPHSLPTPLLNHSTTPPPTPCPHNPPLHTGRRTPFSQGKQVTLLLLVPCFQNKPPP